MTVTIRELLALGRSAAREDADGRLLATSSVYEPGSREVFLDAVESVAGSDTFGWLAHWIRTGEPASVLVAKCVCTALGINPRPLAIRRLEYAAEIASRAPAPANRMVEYGLAESAPQRSADELAVFACGLKWLDRVRRGRVLCDAPPVTRSGRSVSTRIVKSGRVVNASSNLRGVADAAVLRGVSLIALQVGPGRTLRWGCSSSTSPTRRTPA